MKFHLIKNQLFPLEWRATNEKFTTSLWEVEGLTKCQGIIIGNVYPVSNTQVEKAKCTKLEEKLASLFSEANNWETDYSRWRLELELGLSEIEGRIGSTRKGYIALKSLLKGGWLHAIRETSQNTATVTVELSLLPRQQESVTASFNLQTSDFLFAVPHAQVFTREMNITYGGELSSCIDSEIHFPYEYYNNPNFRKNHISFCTITVNIPDTVLQDKGNVKDSHNLPIAATVSELNKKILEEEILADVKIFLANGACIPAHKNILAGQSSVFYTMFTTDMTENRESKVEIPDISENSMRAFLRYLYYQDESVMSAEIGQVFEVYNAAHKYHVKKLEIFLRNRILEQNTSWFELDASLKLFAFVQNLTPVDHEMEAKLVDVLKALMKNAEDSEIYQKLLCDNPAVAVKLCKLSLSSDTAES